LKHVEDKLITYKIALKMNSPDSNPIENALSQMNQIGEHTTSEAEQKKISL
jgi:hypothetical protein